MAKRLQVLVTGATGQQGGAVAHALIDRGHHVRAFTRKPGAARALAARGAETVVGDFADPSSLAAAARGVDAVFLMGNSWEAGPAAEAAQGIAAVDALAKVGVPHVIYTSVDSADRETGIPHFDSKYEVEKRLVASGLPHTIVAPAAFMDNQLAPWAVGSLLAGTLAMALPPDRPLTQVAVLDIGRFVALVAERREEFVGRRIDIAGDAPTGAEMAAALSRAMGRPVSYLEVPLEVLRQQNPEAAIMFEWFDRVGYHADIPGLRREFPEVGWTDFGSWANGVDWRAFDRGRSASASAR
ncbi:MAG TPA: NmrA/HSCARG family protein [Bauldia sp.]|nr:NmrA/HSCARG family protein [Bauldia sp.]